MRNIRAFVMPVLVVIDESKIEQLRMGGPMLSEVESFLTDAFKDYHISFELMRRAQARIGLDAVKFQAHKVEEVDVNTVELPDYS